MCELTAGIDVADKPSRPADPKATPYKGGPRKRAQTAPVHIVDLSTAKSSESEGEVEVTQPRPAAGEVLSCRGITGFHALIYRCRVCIAQCWQHLKLTFDNAGGSGLLD